jgi:hypothetical protein
MAIKFGAIYLVRINEMMQDLTKENYQFLLEVSYEMEAAAVNIVRIAKQKTSKDMGVLARGITYVKKSLFNFEVISASQYSAFAEFGTKKEAANYVTTLPSEFQQFANTFKGIKINSGGLTLAQSIEQWGARRGLERADIHGVYLKILHKGRNPHPFLIPAYLEETQKLESRLNTLFNK